MGRFALLPPRIQLPHIREHATLQLQFPRGSFHVPPYRSGSCSAGTLCSSAAAAYPRCFFMVAAPPACAGVSLPPAPSR
jgi:hypothetical protein